MINSKPAEPIKDNENGFDTISNWSGIVIMIMIETSGIMHINNVYWKEKIFFLFKKTIFVIIMKRNKNNFDTIEQTTGFPRSFSLVSTGNNLMNKNVKTSAKVANSWNVIAAKIRWTNFPSYKKDRVNRESKLIPAII